VTSCCFGRTRARTRPAVWYVQGLHTEPWPYLTAMLCHSSPEFATEADWITDVLPYRLVIEGDLGGTVSHEQIIEVIGHAGPHDDHGMDLRGHDEHGRGFLPLQGPFDNRWRFKEEELRRHNNYVLSTRTRLLDHFWGPGNF
jgi:hypothetical protein